MVAVFARLLTQTRGTPDHEIVKALGSDLVKQLQALLDVDTTNT